MSSRVICFQRSHINCAAELSSPASNKLRPRALIPPTDIPTLYYIYIYIYILPVTTCQFLSSTGNFSAKPLRTPASYAPLVPPPIDSYIPSYI